MKTLECIGITKLQRAIIQNKRVQSRTDLLILHLHHFLSAPRYSSVEITTDCAVRTFPLAIHCVPCSLVGPDWHHCHSVENEELDDLPTSFSSLAVEKIIALKACIPFQLCQFIFHICICATGRPTTTGTRGSTQQALQLGQLTIHTGRRLQCSELCLHV